MKTYNRKLGKQIFQVIDGVTYKLCNKCQQYKVMSADNFHHNKQAICGFKGICIECGKHTPSNRTLTRFNESGQLICRTCGLYKDIDQFQLNSQNTARLGRSTQCKKCVADYKKAARTNSKNIDINTYLGSLLNGCKTRVRKTKNRRNLQFDIDLEFLIDLYNKQSGLCALTNLQMSTIVGKGKHSTNISIDRIDSNKGYTKDNIQLVCAYVNIMKSDKSIEELKYFCQCILNNK